MRSGTDCYAPVNPTCKSTSSNDIPEEGSDQHCTAFSSGKFGIAEAWRQREDGRIDRAGHSERQPMRPMEKPTDDRDKDGAWKSREENKKANRRYWQKKCGPQLFLERLKTCDARCRSKCHECQHHAGIGGNNIADNKSPRSLRRIFAVRKTVSRQVYRHFGSGPHVEPSPR